MWGSDFWDKTWARKYERYTRHHQEIWNQILPYMKGKVVDIGCGPCVMYEKKNIDLTGVDFSAEGIKQAKLHYPKGKYVVAEATNTTLPSNEYDTVVMLGLLDYFSNWNPVIAEAKRLVKPEGKIFATLLEGFQSHKWTVENVIKKTEFKSYSKCCGNWVLVEI